ncbi:hypothetical protein HYFRA_00009500 [Hymenoscyphus fraxineus]|uniref:Protein kinase domain-containing protein n=1 Tax=Hymenoscyphus fraxineus TaxID=746836 RepID=A0A9N9KYT8_9HELO|nr:hypothetical protein HYFRA_00009500 [Hymenoscyphus fraxineus]
MCMAHDTVLVGFRDQPERTLPPPDKLVASSSEQLQGQRLTQRAQEDAQKMQSAVNELCANTGRPQPRYEVVELRSHHLCCMAPISLVRDFKLIFEHRAEADKPSPNCVQTQARPNLNLRLWVRSATMHIINQGPEAILWVHRVGLVHRDIKAANVLITEQGSLQLCDFSVAGIVEGKLDKRTTIIGTPHWKAPELLLAPPGWP